MARRSGVVDVEQMVSAALTDARGAPPAEDAVTLVDGMGIRTRSVAAAAVAFGLAPVETDLSALGGVLSGLSSAFRRAEAHDVVLAGFAEYGVSTVYLGSSTGLRLSFSQPTGAVNLVGRSLDGVRSAWVGLGCARWASWPSTPWSRSCGGAWSGPGGAALARRGPLRGDPPAVGGGRPDGLPVLLRHGRAGRGGRADGVLGSTGDGDGDGGGDGGDRRRTRVGERVTDVPFTLYSDPHEPGIECLPFVACGSSNSESSVFDNGLPLARTDWIRDGILAHLRYHRAGAARSGVEVAPYIDNLVLRGGDADRRRRRCGGGGTVDEMVARTERGLLLTCLWYIREVDPATALLTGLTRDGVYVIEDGAVVGAANNFRFNESPVDLLARATEVGTSVRTLGRELGEYLNRCIMPPLRIPDFNMSSVSQAS